MHSQICGGSVWSIYALMLGRFINVTVLHLRCWSACSVMELAPARPKLWSGPARVGINLAFGTQQLPAEWGAVSICQVLTNSVLPTGPRTQTRPFGLKKKRNFVLSPEDNAWDWINTWRVLLSRPLGF